MKILFLTDNFPPEVNAPASRTHEHCREWVRLGHQVTVITCAPNFPQGKVQEGYRNRWRQREMIDGIEVIRVWSFITANEGFLKRVLDYLSFALTSFIAGLAVDCDVIVATSPQFFTTLSGFALSKMKRRPWVFEVRDLWPATIVAVGAIRNQAILRQLERLELFLYRDARMVVVVTEAFKADLVGRGIDPAKIEVVTNGVDLSAFRPRARDPELEDRLGLKGKTVVSYIGTHGQCQGLEFVVDAASKVARKDLHFLFVGAGAERAMVMERAQALGLSNTTFLEPVPKHEVGRYLSLTDVMLVPLRRSEVFTTVIPSKIFEAAAMEKPILLGVDGEARGIIERFGAGRFYEPEDCDSFLGELEAMTADPARDAKIREGCGRMALAYDRTALARTMLSHLERAARPGRAR